MNEAETCRTLVRPKLETVGWAANGKRFYREQLHITDGRIVVAAGKPHRLKRKIPDFLLYFTRDVVLAVVEAKSDQKPAADGLQQAKDYVRTLGLFFAFTTNGAEIIEYDAFTQAETPRTDFPTPAELWQRYQIGMSLSTATRDPRPAPRPGLLRPETHTPVLSANRHRTGRPGDRRRAEAVPPHPCHRDRQDDRCLPDLLESLVRQLERDRRPWPQAPDSFPRRSEQTRR